MLYASDVPVKIGRRLLTVANCEEALGLSAWTWQGNCHYVAICINSAFKLKAAECYGHYLGPVAADSFFGYQAAWPFHRHGWLVLRDGRVFDPTRWVFTNQAPGLYCEHSSEEYDCGAQRVAALQHSLRQRPQPLSEEQDGIHLLLRRVELQEFVATSLMLGDHRATYFSVQQLHYLANMPIALLGGFAEPLYRALVAAGQAALIPLDNRIEVLYGGNVKRATRAINRQVNRKLKATV